MINRNKKGQFIKGYHPSTEFKKGNKGYWKGKKRPEIKGWLQFYNKGHIPWNKGKRIKKICQNCGKEFSVIPFYSAQKFCSHQCASIINGFKKGHKDFNNLESRKKNSKAHKREKAWNWKGGIAKSGGYIWILKPNHPKANRKYIKRSILVAEKYLGRFLNKGEIIHHINEIKDDDRLKNLYLFSSNNKHLKFHHLKNKPKLIYNILNVG